MPISALACAARPQDNGVLLEGTLRMAMLATPLAAPDQEPWLGAASSSGLRFHLLTAGGVAWERGLDELLRVADVAGTVWVGFFCGDAADVDYALELLGADPDGAAAARGLVHSRPTGDVFAGETTASLLLGADVGRAGTALVDAPSSASGLHVGVLNLVPEAVDSALAALRRHDLAAALRGARLAVLRDGAASWAVLATSPAAAGVLPRAAVVVPAGVPGARLPPAPADTHHRHVWPAAARRGWRGRTFPRRLSAAVGATLIAALAAGSAGWVVAHRTATRQLTTPGNSAPGGVPAYPPPRSGAMTAIWDRTAQVVLFGGAVPETSGHGTPLGDTWRGAVPPADAWQQLHPDVSPSARLRGAMAADVTDGYVLLFGGEASGDVGLDDTWTYASAWGQAAPRTAPPAGPALAATEPSTGRVLLVTVCCALAAVPTGERMQTWRWSGSTWTLLGAAPGWVTTAAIVSDPWDDSVLMLADGGSGLSATFVWNGGTWREQDSVGPPVVPGERPALAYDAATHTVLDVVLRGDGGRSTWAWDGRAWRKAPAAGGPPDVGAVLADSVAGHALLYGGPSPDRAFAQRWFWNDHAWHVLADTPADPPVPAAGFDAAVSTDPGTGGLIFFGGSDTEAQTWLFNGTTWSRDFFIVPSPSPRLGGSMAYDPRRHTAILVGGREVDGALAGDMWEWRGDGWHAVVLGRSPPPALGAPLAWDPVRGEALLLVPALYAVPTPSAATWTWSGSDWQQLIPPVSPPLRDGASLTFDPATGDMLLAVPCCPDTPEQNTETWTWDGADWSRRQTLHQPPIHAFVVSDPGARRTLLVAACCGGFDDAGTVGPPQTWAWDGRDWTRLRGAALPALQDVLGVVDDAQGVPLLVGRVAGAGPRHPVDGLWRWTGSGWLRLV